MRSKVSTGLFTTSQVNHLPRLSGSRFYLIYHAFSFSHLNADKTPNIPVHNQSVGVYLLLTTRTGLPTATESGGMSLSLGCRAGHAVRTDSYARQHDGMRTYPDMVVDVVAGGEEADVGAR